MVHIYSLAALVVGYILDLIIGDPYWMWHPIRLIGWLINASEKVIRKIFPKSKNGELAGGVMLVIIVTGLSTAVSVFILYFAYKINVYAGFVIESIMCYQILATKALKVESTKVAKALENEGLDAGRYAVSMIVGRDTKSLSESGVVKATVETVAENTADGIIAPMLCMAIGGAGFGFFYKAVNTMDSMVGYKNDKYMHFGTAAAKFDDIMNFIPARLAGYMMIFSTLFTKMNTKNAFKIYKRDKYNHASPNSAHTEAVMAGALEVQLAGDAYYFGVLHKKKTIGDDIRPIKIADIKRSNKLLYATSASSIILFVVIKALIEFFVIYS